MDRSVCASSLICSSTLRQITVSIRRFERNEVLLIGRVEFADTNRGPVAKYILEMGGIFGLDIGGHVELAARAKCRLIFPMPAPISSTVCPRYKA